LLAQEYISEIALSDSIENSYALSPMQQGMVFHSLYAADSGVEIEQMVYTLHEDLQAEAFICAWQQVINRHEILRTGFRWEGLDAPVQQVHAAVTLQWRREDWRKFSKEQQQSQLDTYLREDRIRGFNLIESSLNRFALIRTGEAEYQFIWTFHHAIIDGHSFVLVLKEVFAFYDSLRKGEDLQLPLPRPYNDYIKWLAEQDLSKAETFWRDFLKGFTSPTPLTGNHNTHINGHQEYTEQEAYLSVELTRTLKALAKAHGITLNNLVQGAWALLLCRYSGEDEAIFGATRACRSSALDGAEFMVGPFLNTLPMRVETPSNMALLDWLKQIRQQHILLFEYEHTPLMKIQEWSEVPRGRQLFDSILVFQNYELDSYLRSLGEDWEGREFQLFEQTNYKLAVSAWAGEKLSFRLAYDRRNFADATIAGILGHLQTLLKGFAENPFASIGQLQMLTSEEQQQILFEWNPAPTEDTQQLCIHQLFEAQAERTPDGIAVMCEGELLTYSELNSRANQLAHYLQRFAIQPEQFVGIAMQRSSAMLVSILGILKAGAAYVPMDPAYPEERLAAMMADAKPQVLLTERRLHKQLPASDAKVICIDADWQDIAQESYDNLPTVATSQNLAYVIYTSGSTGKPKGVMIEHASLVNFTRSASLDYAISTSDRILQFASLNFDASAEEIYPCLTQGATLVLRNESMLTSISSFLETCGQWGITILDLPTAYWHEMTRQLAAGNMLLPDSLRLVIIGGESVLPERLAIWQRVVGTSPRLVNTYGPTETTIVATKYDLCSPVPEEVAMESTEVEESAHVPIGRAITNVQTYILDRNLQLVPVGVAGELHIGGCGLARGYLHHPELTAKSFIANPFSTWPGARLYKSGDLARFLPDGQIEFCGRVDSQVKIHGFRIELGEIETAILAHHAIQDVIVLAREDTPGEKRLVAYVVSAAKALLQQATLVEELRAFLKNKLPAYMLPSTFVVLETLPVNASGKIARQQLPAPDLTRQQSGHQYIKPNNPLQYQLVQIWEELFDRRPIGIRDNFFELGGHSLLPVRMMTRLEQVLGKKLPLATLFKGATIEHLSEVLVKEQLAGNRAPLVAVQPEGSKQPFFYLHGDFQGGGMYCLSLARHLESEQPFYAIQPHGLEGESIPKTIEEMAADHVKTLRAFQPVGPYQLGGHCNGGLLAFEMARQLQTLGQEVNLLVLVCTTGINARHINLQKVVNHYCSVQGLDIDKQQDLFLKAREFSMRLSSIWQYCSRGLKKLAQWSIPEHMAFVRRKGRQSLQVLADLFSQAKRNNRTQAANPGKALQAIEDLSQYSNKAYARAMSSYVPQKYVGQVTLFWPQEWVTDTSDDPAVGWRDVATDVDLHIVPGGHLTCLIQHTEELAKHLQSCLNTAQAKMLYPGSSNSKAVR
jgi:surfactin family lipopeptide synthetase C